MKWYNDIGNMEFCIFSNDTDIFKTNNYFHNKRHHCDRLFFKIIHKNNPKGSWSM